ncbi:protein THEM6-like [Mya arenaria]|uniref:protein THEM6-like n=1 Tax=Mya arenaria TaxID=6604 RepID=UPI0022E7CE46|nr:protein THEM6-like [Mya arenaria]
MNMSAIFWFVLFIISTVFDMIHAVRMFYALFLSKIFHSKVEKKHLLELSSYQKRCMPNDLDIFMHMNNANYLKHCDIGRILMWKQNGVLDKVFKMGGGMTLGASNNRYRKSIILFDHFRIETKVIYWDDTAFYVEQQFIRTKDNFVCFVSILKQTLVGIKPDEVVKIVHPDIEKPPLLPELEKWMESISFSSERLRKTS